MGPQSTTRELQQIQYSVSFHDIPQTPDHQLIKIYLLTYTYDPLSPAPRMQKSLMNTRQAAQHGTTDFKPDELSSSANAVVRRFSRVPVRGDMKAR